MTFQIKKSQIGDDAAVADFKKRVTAFRQARLDHQKTVDVPAPTEHLLVEAAVRRVSAKDAPDDHVEDYEIIDDTPKPTLREKKDALIRSIMSEEEALLTASLPPGKRRLDDLKAGDVCTKHPDTHTDDEKAFMAARNARIVREKAIIRHAAEQCAEVEDLTDETIGSWQPAPFPSS